MIDIRSRDAGDRVAMNRGNRLKLGLFGANCSSGRAATKVPERWSGAWEENLRLAQLADDAGMDFMLPIGRWRGYGGETNFEGRTLETITWATGLLAQTKQLRIFATVHAPLFNPVSAAKMFVTADHVGRGRFGLNIVCGWNQDEFDMFGVDQRDHESRYRYGRAWLDVVERLWSDDTAPADVDNEFFHLRGLVAEPKPYGASPTGREFGIANCDLLFAPLTDIAKGLDEFPWFRDEVLPRLVARGIRTAPGDPS